MYGTEKRLIRALYLIVFACILLIYNITAKAETMVCVCPESQYVNVRNKPSSSAATLGRLHRGDEVTVDGIEKGFIQINFNGQTGFVSTKFFEEPVKKNYTVDANGRVRVRTSPNGERSGWIEPGMSVFVSAWRYATDGTRWAKCAGEYISADYLIAAE